MQHSKSLIRRGTKEFLTHLRNKCSPIPNWKEGGKTTILGKNLLDFN